MKYLIKGCFWAILMLIFEFGASSKLNAAVVASSLAMIGYDDEQDTFTVLALDQIEAGEVIYFTNNGWDNTMGRFNGADATQGAGNESLIKLTMIQSVARGTVISSTITGGAWEWTTSGLIPGQVGGMAEFSHLALDYESDQIYAFQASTGNPLLNPTAFLYALHFGSVDYPEFFDAEDTLSGAIPQGLSTEGKTAFAHTNLTFHGDADGNHSAWGVDLNAPALQFLQSTGGTRDQWLEAIANSDNWGAGQPAAAMLNVTPEPGRVILASWGLLALCLRRRRWN